MQTPRWIWRLALGGGHHSNLSSSGPAPLREKQYLSSTWLSKVLSERLPSSPLFPRPLLSNTITNKMFDLAQIGQVNAKVRALYLLASTKAECYHVEGTISHVIAWPDPTMMTNPPNRLDGGYYATTNRYSDPPLPPTIHPYPWASADAPASLVAALLRSPPSPPSQYSSQPDSTSPARR